MGAITKVQPIEGFLNVALDEARSPRQRQESVADFARDQLAAALGLNRRVLGRTPQHKTFVNGRENAALESVDPERGKIVFEFELLTDVLRSIAQMLVDRSPVRKGDYLRGHRLFADGHEIAVGADGLVPQAEEYTFLNLVPYARKIEIGKTESGRDFLIQVPNRIYERTAADAKRRFGNIARIKFSYRSPLLSYVEVGRGGPKTAPRPSPARRAAASIERASRAPAIIVSMR